MRERTVTKKKKRKASEQQSCTNGKYLCEGGRVSPLQPALADDNESRRPRKQTTTKADDTKSGQTDCLARLQTRNMRVRGANSQVYRLKDTKKKNTRNKREPNIFSDAASSRSKTIVLCGGIDEPPEKNGSHSLRFLLIYCLMSETGQGLADPPSQGMGELGRECKNGRTCQTP